jgi:hypothetical protein
MNSYILKSVKNRKKVLLYQEKEKYEFTPKKSFYHVKKVTILDNELLSNILQNKIIKRYNRLLKIIYSLATEDDTTSGDVLIAYKEIERIKEYLLSIEKNLDKKFVEVYLKKLYVLELELKKVHVIELKTEIEEERVTGGR